MSEEVKAIDLADKSIEAYETLSQNIPSIGFLSRKKRIIVTKMAQQFS